MRRPLELVSAKTNPAGGRGRYITLAVLLGAVPLLLINWYIVVMILGRDCVIYEGGNITGCGGGISEEEMSGVSGLIALVILAIQIGLIVLVSRRTRFGLQ
ncbi:hypothetical protein [Sphaerisporangium sp. NPDC051011]|uniref:hypothetical protein n=1 Tax=Sphaerisporangium sp. NPDC051011 TaxID=3155792 RepID=UPI0033DAF8FD